MGTFGAACLTPSRNVPGGSLLCIDLHRRFLLTIVAPISCHGRQGVTGSEVGSHLQPGFALRALHRGNSVDQVHEVLVRKQLAESRYRRFNKRRIYIAEIAPRTVSCCKQRLQIKSTIATAASNPLMLFAERHRLNPLYKPPAVPQHSLVELSPISRTGLFLSLIMQELLRDCCLCRVAMNPDWSAKL
jgi:hypothetical protein